MRTTEQYGKRQKRLFALPERRPTQQDTTK